MKTVSDKSCKAFTGLSIRAKMVRGGRSLLHENLVKTDPPCSAVSAIA